MIKKVISLSVVGVVGLMMSACSVSPESVKKAEDIPSAHSLHEHKNFSPPNIGENEKRYITREYLSEFTPIEESRKAVTKKADDFCKKMDRKTVLTEEDIVLPPYMINHYPNITLTFVCKDMHAKAVVKKESVAAPAPVPMTKTSNSRYDDLITVKKLLDDGILTQKEFDEEKRKILNRK
jgi:hypothetical protein